MTVRLSVNDARVPVHVSLLEWKRAKRRFERVGSTVRTEGKTRLGNATWAAVISGAEIALTWAWREALPNIVALSDPLGIQSNAVLFDEQGKPIVGDRRILLLNGVVYALPWQSEFRQAFAGHALAA